MQIAINTVTRRVVTWANEAINELSFTRGDIFPVEIRFIEGAGYIALPAGATGRLLLKQPGAYAASPMAADLSWAATGSGRTATYTFTLNLDTAELGALFVQEPASISLVLEIEWQHSGTRQTTIPVPVTVANEYIRQTEGLPGGIPNLKATQAESEAGESNEKWMTPLGTRQAIAAQATNASLLTSGTLPDARLSSSVAASLAKAATALQAGAVISSISGLQAALDGKATSAQGALAESALQDSEKGAANGVATLDANQKLTSSQIPDLTITDFLGACASQAEMLAKTGQKGDWVTRSDDGKVYVITGDSPAQASSWTALTYPVAAAQQSADWNATSGVTQILNKPSTFAPSAHKSSHAIGGSDALTPADIGAAPTNNPTFTDKVSIEAGPETFTLDENGFELGRLFLSRNGVISSTGGFIDLTANGDGVQADLKFGGNFVFNEPSTLSIESAPTEPNHAVRKVDLDGKASTSHKSTHATGGSDALTPADIGAQPAGSYATLDTNSKLTASQLPDLAITEFLGACANQTEMLAKPGQKGDWVTRSDDGKVYVITGDAPSQASSWTALSYPAAPTQQSADWDATSGVTQILNKPTLGTAAATAASDYATSAQGAKADTALQPEPVSYLGDYNNGLSYNLNAVVKFNGQLYIRVSNPLNSGYAPGHSSWGLFNPEVGSPAFDLFIKTAIAAKQTKTVYGTTAPDHEAGLEWVDTSTLRSYRSYLGAWVEI